MEERISPVRLILWKIGRESQKVSFQPSMHTSWDVGAADIIREIA
jgi:hypothetical protein